MADFSTTHDVPPCLCPYCRKHLDAATGYSGGPSPGDVTVCLDCGGLCVFRPDLTVRAATKAEARRLTKHPEVRMVQAAVAAVRPTRH